MIAALHHQRLLVVLRSYEPLALLPRLVALEAIGLRHVELAWSAFPAWIEHCRELQKCCPSLQLGAASVCQPEAVQAAAAAGLTYAFSPVLDPALLVLARQLGIALVPGVMSPTEVYQAKALGCGLVKLFPASCLGLQYWSRLRAPLGALPFCIAAGGLAVADVEPWLAAGVDAVALGGLLADGGDWEALAGLVEKLTT